MNPMRGCLMLIGLVMLAVVGSCVLGVSSAVRINNPTRFSRMVEDTPERTRRILGDYLEVAENEGPGDRGLGKLSNKLFVGEFTDGTLRMTLDGDKGQLMRVIATFKPGRDEGTTEVEVFSDADALAEQVRPRVQASALHREIRAQISDALSAIDRHKLVGGGFLISDMINDARGEYRSRMRRMY